MEISEAFSPIRAIKHGFAAIQRAPAALLVGAFLMFIVTGGSSGGGGGNIGDVLDNDASPEVNAAMLLIVLGIVGFSLCVGLVFFVVRCWLLPGWLRLHRHVLETGEDSFSVLFSGSDGFLRMVGWRLLASFITFGTVVFAAIPGGALMVYGISQDEDMALVGAGVVLLLLTALPVSIFVSLGLRLGDYGVALEGLGPMEALDRSWELARGHRLQLFVYFLVTDLFGVLGLIFCCVGIFVTRGISDIGTTESYLLATVPGADGWLIPREEGL